MNCLEIKKSIKHILNRRGSLPSIVSSNKSLQDDLAGKRFVDLPDSRQRMIYGDITIFNKEAFHYYVFEMIEDALNRKELPVLFDMFILGLSNESVSFDDRLTLLDKNEKQTVLKFLECVLEYITTSKNVDASILKEDYQKDIEEIIVFWRTIQ